MLHDARIHRDKRGGRHACSYLFECCWYGQGISKEHCSVAIIDAGETHVAYVEMFLLLVAVQTLVYAQTANAPYRLLSRGPGHS